MALPSLVEPADFEEWLGATLTADQLARAGAVLRAASTHVRRQTGRQWITDEDNALDESTPTIDDNDLEVAQTVVKQMAERKWTNPAGLIQETTGPFSQRYADTAAEGLYLTETEKAMLDPYRTSRAGLWTLRTTRGLPYDDIYVDVDPPGKPLPAGLWPT